MEPPLEFILSLWSRIFYIVQNEIYKSEIIFPSGCRTVFLCCLYDPPHNPTWNCRLLGGHRQDSHKLLVWYTPRGPHLTTLHGHPVHVGCLEGATGRNKATQVQFTIMTPFLEVSTSAGSLLSFGFLRLFKPETWKRAHFKYSKGRRCELINFASLVSI